MRMIPLLLAVALTGGCTHANWADLRNQRKPGPEKHFVLEKDHTRTQTRGIGYTWVEGLRAGTYTLQAEDEEGLYFVGDGPCVIVLFDQAAEEFLKTGKATNPTMGPIPTRESRYASGRKFARFIA